MDRANQLQFVVVGDEPAAWEAGGFALTGDDRDRVWIGSTCILLRPDAGKGIADLVIDGVKGELDGLPISTSPEIYDGPPAHLQNPNRVTAMDHLVVMTPNCDRTTAAFEAAGLEARRVRQFEMGGATRRQTFFWLGDVILELVGADEPEPNSDGTPALAWGLALTCDDLEAGVTWLGDSCSPSKVAVQPGRRIATMRTKAIGISTAIAMLSPHPTTE